MKPVVIVGAGLAGLTCARTLKRNRIPFQLFEASDRIGGRLRTEIGDYPLDHGTQFYFTGYPTAREQLDEDKLQLQKFEPGAYVVWDGVLHLITRDKPVQMALSGFLGLGDKFRLSKWTSDVQWLDPTDISELPDRTTEKYLQGQGFSPAFIDRVARPFFGSLFLDRSLRTSSRHAVFLWKSLTEGECTVPAMGIEEIPKQIGASFGPDVLHLNTRVSELLTGGGARLGVRLEGGEEVEAASVVLACDAPVAAALSGLTLDVEFVQGIALYFSASHAPLEPGWLVLNGNMRGISDHVVTMPNGSIAVTITGQRSETDDQLAEIVRSELRLWFPGSGVEDWKFLAAYRFAQMAQPAGYAPPTHESGVPGLYLAGEYTTDGSIDGAIRSGIECADLILSHLVAGVA